MTALSFFSYKGGVGRTLALANLAMRLAEFGKSVMIIDFDLEAPGVPFKLRRLVKPKDINCGIVDYVYEFSKHGKLDDIGKYVLLLPKNNPSDSKMWFIPAGNNNISEYWKKLSEINWFDMFYREGGNGLRLFLDLKEKIKKQYNPDFLLIDSRTGITELSGISLKILADEAVIFFSNNEENINGTEKVLSFLLGNQNNTTTDRLRTHLVLTRIPKPKDDIKEKTLEGLSESATEFQREYRLVTDIKKRFEKAIIGKTFEINVVHTDERLQLNETIAFADTPSGIFVEHMKLFEALFKEKFDSKDWERQKNKREAVKLYNEALRVKEISERIALLKKAIKLDSDKWEYYYQRGLSFYNSLAFHQAIEDFKKSIQLNETNPNSYYALSSALFRTRHPDQALDAIDQALKLNPNNDVFIQYKATILEEIGETDKALRILNEALVKHPMSHQLLNARANLLRKMRKPEDALKDVFRAIEIYPHPVYYSTLAEIYGDMGKAEEFYLNLTTSLSKGMHVTELRSAKDAYEKFRNEPRFIELLRSYNMNPEDIFSEDPIWDEQRLDSESES